MSFTIISTVGPATLMDEKLRSINSKGNCIFRINGAHANSSQATEIIHTIRKAIPNAKIMIDLPGNKIRTANLARSIPLSKNETFNLQHSQVNYQDFYKFIKIGDTIFANDSIYKLEVTNVTDTHIVLKSDSDGQLQTNKGLHIHGICNNLPFLFSKDIDLIKTAMEQKVDCLSLSYVRNQKDIQEVKKHLGNHLSDVTIFAKIETASAVENLGEILHEVDHVNVDRGDLSADIGILKLAYTQERIIDSALRAKKNIFLATQFLKNMEINPVPLIAEIIDLHKTIKSGVAGIQLSDETAVGKYPVECVELVFNVYRKSFSG